MRQCLCGCGGALAYLDKRGRKRKYIHGHNGKKQERKTLSSSENVARVRAWRIANPDKFSAQRKRHDAARYSKHRERELERSKVYQRGTRPERSAVSREWRSKNRDLVKIYAGRSRANRKRCAGTHTLEQWISRIEYWGWRCRYCGCELTPKTVTVDHSIPLSRGGTNWAANLVPACWSCNTQKHTCLPCEFLARGGK